MRYGEEWGGHFFVDSPSTIATAPTGRAPFAVTHLLSGDAPPDHITTPTEDSFLIAVLLKPLAKGLWDHWIDGKQINVPLVPAFHSSIFDLQAEHAITVRSSFDAVHFNIPRETVDAFTDDHELSRVLSIRSSICENDHAIANLTRLIIPFLSDERERSELFLDHFGLLLCARLVEGYSPTTKLKAISKGGLAPWQKRRAEELLMNHLAGDLRLERLARECDLSSGHFARAFKTTFGVSVHRWVLEQRIEHAKALLTHTKLPLLDVTERTGFSSQSTFTRAFQQRVGVSPGQWRRTASSPRRRSSSVSTNLRAEQDVPREG